jgi:hypothetical protein
MNMVYIYIVAGETPHTKVSTQGGGAVECASQPEVDNSRHFILPSRRLWAALVTGNAVDNVLNKGAFL